MHGGYSAMSRFAAMGLAILMQCVVVLAVPSDARADVTGIRIDPTDVKQAIHSFGASDAWRCEFVGRNWPVAKRNAIADLLFSRKLDRKGDPKGIGLSMWRFYVGSGSAEQGESSGIANSWRRGECFLNPDGSYDWSREKGQRWFLDAAKARGVDYLLAFSIAPPVQYSLNGKAYSDKDRSTLNIRAGALLNYAGFLVDIAEHFKKAKGITIDYMSPANEPQWGWESNTQEGTPSSNDELHEFARLIGTGMKDRGLSTRVILGESADLEFLTGPKWAETRSDQVKAFWDKSSPDYLGNLPNVEHAISGHSYWSTWPIPMLTTTRESLRKRIEQIDPALGFWQTEFCVMENNDEVGQGWVRDLGMDTALYVARVIHADLTIANASHWSWWTALSECDYKDGLIYLDYDTNYTGERRPDRTELQRDGRFLPSKTLWALGNYSRFVRPGMVRIGVSYEDRRSQVDTVKGLMVSAYVGKPSKRLVAVLINPTHESAPVRITSLGTGLRIAGNEFTTYTTSQTCDLSRGSSRADRLSIPPRSIVTLVGKLR